MRFNELAFLAFIGLFLPVYFLLGGGWRRAWLLVASYFFYAWWDWRFLSLLWLTTLMDYGLARCIEQAVDERVRRRWLGVSLAANLCVLGVFKYYNFFAASLESALERVGVAAHPPTLGVILPVGLSFYTLMSMSYTIDVYRRKVLAEKDLSVFAAFVCFFPHLVAGPILRPEHFLPQLKRAAAITAENLLQGSAWVVLGFLKKIVLADSLAPYADKVFAVPSEHSALGIGLGVVFYAFQIYGDFSGYSDIAYGLAKIMGFDLGYNFRRPYLAENFSDFWRRWHISLSSWLRDYLYIPLGGNRTGPARTGINLSITMLAGGLWHGANWTFVIWGWLHGLYLVGQHWLGVGKERPVDGGGTVSPAWLRVLKIAGVFACVCLAWVFFRSATIGEAFDMIGRMATQGDWSWEGVRVKFVVIKGLMLIVFLVCAEIVAERHDVDVWLASRPLGVAVFIGIGLCLLGLLGSFSGGQFIYFQF